LSIRSEKEINLRILLYVVRQQSLYLLLKCRYTVSLKVASKPFRDHKEFRIDGGDENASSPKI